MTLGSTPIIYGRTRGWYCDTFVVLRLAVGGRTPESIARGCEGWAGHWDSSGSSLWAGPEHLMCLYRTWDCVRAVLFQWRCPSAAQGDGKNEKDPAQTDAVHPELAQHDCYSSRIRRWQECWCCSASLAGVVRATCQRMWTGTQ
jgi:hypothetical protein